MKHGQGFDPFNKTFINNRLTDQALSNIGGSASDFFRLKYECAEARSGFGRVQFDERIMEEVKKAESERAEAGHDAEILRQRLADVEIDTAQLTEEDKDEVSEKERRLEAKRQEQTSLTEAKFQEEMSLIEMEKRQIKEKMEMEMRLTEEKMRLTEEKTRLLKAGRKKDLNVIDAEFTNNTNALQVDLASQIARITLNRQKVISDLVREVEIGEKRLAAIVNGNQDRLTIPLAHVRLGKIAYETFDIAFELHDPNQTQMNPHTERALEAKKAELAKLQALLAEKDHASLKKMVWG